MSRKVKKTLLMLVLPGVIFIVVFMVIPLFMLLFTSFYPDGGSFSLSGYSAIFGSTYFKQVFLRSLRLSVLTTAVCLLLGFPTAYFVAKYTNHKGILMAFAVFPMFTSPVIRSFSWMVLLGKKGIVNATLVKIGIVDKPLSILYNEPSIVIGLVQLFMPLMILSLIGVLESIPDDLLLASRSLGATRIGAFRHVILPLSVSGLVTGSVLVFTGSMTAYATPALLGGTDTRVLSTMLYQYAMSMGDWNKAAIVALIMIVVTLVISQGINLLSRKLNPAQ